MNSSILAQVGRFFLLLLLQVLVFRYASPDWSQFNYISVLIYPLFILLLPFRTLHPLLVFLGFFMGICVDLFYYSYGVHAAAGAFTGFIRPYILNLLEPRGGYNQNSGPVKYSLGTSWFVSYISIAMGLHLFFYFSVEAFSFVYLTTIVARTIFSFIPSLFFIMIYMFLFNPKN